MIEDDIDFIKNHGFTLNGEDKLERNGVVVEVKHRSVIIIHKNERLTFFRRKERYLWRYFIQRLVEDDWEEALRKLYEKIDDIILLTKVLA